MSKRLSLSGVDQGHPALIRALEVLSSTGPYAAAFLAGGPAIFQNQLLAPSRAGCLRVLNLRREGNLPAGSVVYVWARTTGLPIIAADGSWPTEGGTPWIVEAFWDRDHITPFQAARMILDDMLAAEIVEEGENVLFWRAKQPYEDGRFGKVTARRRDAARWKRMN